MQYRERGSVRALIRDKGLRAVEVSRACGISMSHLNAVLSGATNPSPRTAVAISDALGERVEMLFPEMDAEKVDAEA